MSTRRDWTTDIGLLVVGVAAAILTFTTLRDLAEQCGITGTFLGLRLSYLVPVTVDAAGVVAARVWLKRTGGPDAIRFGRTLAWACIGASILGNAGQHGMAAYGIVPPWWVVVLVSAVPPATLGAVVHLGHLTRRTDETAADRTTDRTGPDRRTVQAVADRTAPDRPDRAAVDTADRPAIAAVPNHPGPAADQGRTGGPDPLLDAVREWLDRQTGTPSQRQLRAEFGIGAGRARRLMEAAA